MNSEKITVHALHCGGDVTDWATFDPFDPRVGQKVYNPYFMYVVRHPEATVLFDTGVHPELGTSPETRMGPAAASFPVEISPEDKVESRLATLDLKPTDIDIVVVSHLHFDHAGGLEWLTHAPVYVQSSELDFAFDPPVYQKEIFVRADFDHGLDWRKVDGDHDLLGDSSIRLIHTPGHTPGHQSMLVELAGRPLFLLADAAYTLEKMRERSLPGILWSPDATMATWEMIDRIQAETGATLVTSHQLDYEETVKIAPGAWYE